MKGVLRCLVFAVATVGCGLAVNVTVGVVNLGSAFQSFDQALRAIQESQEFPETVQINIVEKSLDVKSASLPALSAEVANFRDEEVCATVVLDCWDDHCPDSSFILRALPQPIIRVGPPVNKNHYELVNVNTLDIVPSANQLAMALQQTIENFGWRSLTIFYHKTGGYHEVAEEVMSLMSQSDTFYRMAEIADSEEDSAHLEQLEVFLRSSKNRKEKHFLLIADSETTNKVLHQAHGHLMLDPRHHWILSNLEVSELELFEYRNTGVHLTVFKLWTRWHLNFMFEDAFQRTRQVYTLQNTLAFDAASVVSHAARITAEQQDVCHGIRTAVPEVRFNGSTGEVAFGPEGTRLDLSLEIMELSSDGRPAHVGHWQEGFGVSLEEWANFTHEQSADPILGGRHLKLLGRLKNPWLVMKEGASCKFGVVCPRKNFAGFFPDLMDHLQKRLGFTWEMNLTKLSIGDKVKDEWDGLTGALINKKADTVLYGATTRSKRTEVLEYSFPLAHQGYYIIIKRADTTLNIMDVAGIFEFLAPFDNLVWAAIGAAVVAVSVSLFFINILDPFEWRGLAQRGLVEEDEGKNLNLVQSLWFTYGCLVGQGGENLPKSIAGRVVAGTWWFFILVTVASYTANLAAFLGRANKIYAIHTLEQLVADRTMAYGTYKSYTLLDFVQNTTLSPYREMGKYIEDNADTAILDTKEEGLRRAAEGNYAFIAGANFRYLLQNEWCNLTLASEPFFKSMIALPFLAGSPYIEPINRALMAMQDEGVLDSLRLKHLEKSGKCMTHQQQDGVLRINNFKGVFIVLLLGITAGAIVGLFECFGHQGRKLTKKALNKSCPKTENAEANITIGSET
ncbi:glutamate receptor ionotropic, kainate 2-like [Branchiostoma floridae x Branchiostoma belcheri]